MPIVINWYDVQVHLVRTIVLQAGPNRGKDFINKLKIVEEELDESIFFLELLNHFNPPFDETIEKNVKEANELLAIIVQSLKTAQKNQKKWVLCRELANFTIPHMENNIKF